MSARPILLASEDERLTARLQTAGFLPIPVGPSWLEELDREDRNLLLVDDACDVEVHAHLRGMAGARRRDLYVVAVSERALTGEPMEAWRRSVDLVVNTADLPRLLELVEAGVLSKTAFYGRFRELARTQGDG